MEVTSDHLDTVLLFLVIPKNWGLYGQDPPPLAVFQPSNDDVNDVSSTTRPSDVDVRYHGE